MKFTIDYTNEEEREALEPLNPGVYPKVIETTEFAVCGINPLGRPFSHMHGNPSGLVRQVAGLTEDVRLAVMKQLVREVASGNSNT